MNKGVKNAVISLEGRFTQKIISGEKTVELRRRKISLRPKDIIWAYSKIPSGCIEARIFVENVVVDSPSILYKKYWNNCGITKKEFYAYFDGVDIGYAILLGKVDKVETPLNLQVIRDKIRDKHEEFHPPQFIKYLWEGNPILDFFEGSLALDPV